MKTPLAPSASSTGARLVPKASKLLLALGIHLAGFTAYAVAAPGDLDPGFGTGGRVIIDQAGSGYEVWDHVLPLPNGDVLVAGWTGSLSSISTEKHIVRLDSKGEMVPSFGNQGQVVLNFGSLPGAATDRSAINGLIALPGGEILAVVLRSYTINSVERVSISLVRLRSNGSLNTTFGGDGIVEVDTLRSNMNSIAAVALDQAGRIVIAGSSGASILRLTSEGYLDSSFSGDGIAKPYPLPNFYVNTMVVQSDDKILLAGYVQSGVVNDYNDNLVVCRVLSDGNLDPSFASAGKLVMDLYGGADVANTICIRPNGKIVVAGYTRTPPVDNPANYKSLFVGLDQNGALDNSFGSGGIAEIDVSNQDESITAATLMPDGRIVASCAAMTVAGLQFTVLRLMPNGVPDPSLAAGGIARIINPESVNYDMARDIALDASGGILVFGISDAAEGLRGMLVRLKGDPDSDGDGVVDANETNTGIYVSPFDTGTNPNNRDSDGDGLSDGEEAYRYLTLPLVGDSDEDGFLDGYEVQTGKSPTDPLDKPGLVAMPLGKES